MEADGHSHKYKNLDFGLVAATAVILGVISLLCVGAMFYYRAVRLDQAREAVKQAWLVTMNRAVTPPIIGLILVLALCIPKRLLPRQWLWRLVAVLGLAAGAAFALSGFRAALVLVLAVSVTLQGAVVVMAALGSGRLNFLRPGYWQRLGSALVHLGLVLFVLDLLLYRYHTLHLALFWSLTLATLAGLLFSFYPGFFARVTGRGGADGGPGRAGG